MRIRIPATAKAILDALHTRGFEAYIVGGCVRDSILGRVPADWDITTNAKPEEVRRIFSRTVDTGIKHGTVTVLVGSRQHEVTTYRIDGKYTDGRHPDSVTYTPSLTEDLKRRDFTINAMAYNEEDGLVDLFGGMDDLQRKLIRCVGNPLERFSEDALRILRAVRLSAQLNFSIDDDTLSGISILAHTLSRISAERICTELIKLICSSHPEYLKVAYKTGITRVILPEFNEMMRTPQNNPHHMYDVGTHTLVSMMKISPEKNLRLTMLLHDVGKPSCRTTDERGIDHFVGHAEAGTEIAGKVLHRLKLDNATIQTVTTLIRYHDCRVLPQERQVRRLISRTGPELFHDLIRIQEADTLAQSEYHRDDKLGTILRVEKIGEKIIREKQPVSVKDLAVTGRDLMDAGIPEGPEVGRILRAALDEVLDDPAKNTREYIIRLARKMAGR